MKLCSIYSVLFVVGNLYAIDINKGRLRILRETAKLHQVDDVITAINADLRAFAVSFPSMEDGFYKA